MQNAELARARDRLETLLAKYTDLYDFAPIGYFSLDQEGRILEVNLTGAALLAIERGRLLGSSLTHFVAEPSRPTFRSFLAQVFSQDQHQACDVALIRKGRTSTWANLHGAMAPSSSDGLPRCRVAVADITPLVEAREVQRRVDLLTVANRELAAEIARRKAVEQALKGSQRKRSRLLKESRTLQQQLRQVSHQILQAQEEERKRISRELHDEVSQILVGVQVRLEALIRGATIDPKGLAVRVADTQCLLEQAVAAVHTFARELRPPQLDDLGLIPSLQSLLKEFTERSRVEVRFACFPGVERLGSARRTVLYRVAQSALSNVARHARASQVSLDITHPLGSVRMEITDNGRAFDVHQTLHAARAMRLGLVGMRERVEMVGGRFSVTSSPGKGTSIQVEIPHTS